MSSDIIASFALPYTFKRYAPPVLVKGQMQPAVEILNGDKPWTMLASIQNVGGFESLAMPEGYRNKDACKL